MGLSANKLGHGQSTTLKSFSILNPKRGRTAFLFAYSINETTRKISFLKIRGLLRSLRTMNSILTTKDWVAPLSLIIEKYVEVLFYENRYRN